MRQPFDLAFVERQMRLAVQVAFLDASALLAEGWRIFVYESDYFGSHTELDEGPERDIYLFHPTVNFSQWLGVRFSHGHHGRSESNELFQQWLERVEEEKYLLL